MQELLLKRPQSRVAIDREFDRRPVERGRFLRHVRDAPLRREIGVALVGVQLAAQQREQARLARAVGADEADAVARVERARRRLRAARLAPRRRLSWKSGSGRKIPEAAIRIAADLR